MSEVVQPILQPDKGAMLEHLKLLFGRAMEGKIEITAIKAVPAEERTGPRHRFFDVEQLEEAADWAASVNCDPAWNVYVGAALRKPDTFPGDVGTDADFFKTYAVWVDADSAAQWDSAKSAYREAGLPPALGVITGREPERRAQMWWPLETPISDIEVLRATLRGMADAMQTDHGVLTGKQLMRLAGSLAWPKPKKEGRVLEVTALTRIGGSMAEVPLEALHRAFPKAEKPPREPVEGVSGGILGSLAQKDLESALRAIPADLREDWVRIGHALKGLGEVGRELWFEWSKTSPKFEEPEAWRAWESFKPTSTDYRAVFAEAQRLGWENPAKGRNDGVGQGSVSEDAAEEADDDLFEVLSVADIKALPPTQWVLKDAIPQQGLGFVYGAPGSFKSFVCYDLALTLAHACPSWIDREIQTSGSVLYIASEGSSGARKRLTAWEKKQGLEDDTAGFYLIRKTMSFMDAGDVDKLERTVAAHVDRSGPVAVVFVDTVSRVLPGADENMQKDMTLFVGACDRIRERFGATVVGVHHTNKNGDMRGSTVFLGQGDFIFRLDKDDNGQGGVMTCEKQKDAEDGWKLAFQVEKQEWMEPGHIELVSSLTIAWNGEPRAEEPASRWPSRDTLRGIQRALSSAFAAGSPLSMAPQTRRDGRHAPTRISSMFDVPASVVEDVLQTWLDTGMVEIRGSDKHTKMRGIEVVKWID